MSNEIDWSKAPEGYPIWIQDLTPNEDFDGSGWHKDDGDRYTDQDGGYWTKPEEGFYVVHMPPAQWTGTGLPPAGTVCEIQHEVSGIDSDWIMAKINYSSPHNIVATSIDGGIEFVAFTRKSRFRPIRTPEQIAAEERRLEIHRMVDTLGSEAPTTGDFIKCEILYDAGYRKTGDAK